MLNGNYPEDEVLKIKIVRINNENMLYSKMDTNSSFLIDEISNDTIANQTNARKRDSRNFTNLFSESYLNLDLILLPNLFSLSEALRFYGLNIKNNDYYFRKKHSFTDNTILIDFSCYSQSYFSEIMIRNFIGLETIFINELISTFK